METKEDNMKSSALDCNNVELTLLDSVCLLIDDGMIGYRIKDIAFLKDNFAVLSLQSFDGTKVDGLVDSNTVMKINMIEFPHYFL